MGGALDYECVPTSSGPAVIPQTRSAAAPTELRHHFVVGGRRQALHIAQSSLSGQIRRRERRIGVVLTEAGRLFLPLAVPSNGPATSPTGRFASTTQSSRRTGSWDAP